MRKRQSKGGNCHPREMSRNRMLGTYIRVTDHAIQRYQERIKKVNREKAQHSIIESVKRSRLIALTKYGGREIRENRGLLFVCEMDGRTLNIITILISDAELRFVG